jgi:hypothetical protein
MALMPVLVSVAVAVLLAPTAVGAKLTAPKVALGATPVPPSATVAKPPPLCAKASVPDKAPMALGVNATLVVHEAPTAMLAQLLVCEKCAPPEDSPTPDRVKAAVPVLVTVTACAALVVLVCCAAKLKLAGLMLAKP